MKKYIMGIIVSLFVGIGLVQAQTPVYYRYDDAGNRELRTIVLANIQSQSAKVDTTSEATDVQSKTEQKFEETIEKTKITIYPNPTKGLLKIDISGFDFNNVSSVNIYSAKGLLLVSRTSLTDTNLIDLSNYAVGIYILKIKLGDSISEWKIVKE
jgi:hypothetical protein